MDKGKIAPYVITMKELLRTTDPTIIAYASALLDDADIPVFLFDVNMSVLEGGIGILPQRMMVADRDHFMANAIMRDHDIDLGHG
jgi:hypothetical protein